MKKYSVSAISNPFGEAVGNDFNTDDSLRAIEEWFKLSEKYPTCVSICCVDEEAGMELLKCADRNHDILETYIEIYPKMPYKLDWLFDMVKNKVESGKAGIQWKYDQVFPFDMG